MSRTKISEVSSPISLFPFIGILICTMGALLVILVAVSRSARDSAGAQIASRQKSAATPATGQINQKLEKINRYVGSLNQVRSLAETKLHEERLRLGHVEDHIRRLQARLQSLQQAAVEIESLEEEHYDDREQAERELQRLVELIATAEGTIAEGLEESLKSAKSYALVPYEGPNGTYRRPIYIECVANELILQPEGVRITQDDLRPPVGPGNPLAAALRAARDHLVRLHPGEGKSRDTEPYPLMLVRPDGLIMYNYARRAIEAGDFDFGFELCESDWELKYPLADPTLAGLEQLAMEQARARQAVMARAAPRAYRNPSFADSGEFDFGDGSGGAGGIGSGAPGVYVVEGNQGSDDDEFGEYGGDSGEPDGGNSESGGYGASSGMGSGGTSGSSGGVVSGGHDGGALGSGGYAVASGMAGGPATSADESVGQIAESGGGASSTQASGSNIGVAAAGGGAGERSPIGGMHSAGTISNSPEGGVGTVDGESGNAPNAVSLMAGTPPSRDSDPHGDKQQFQSRGRDWALRHKPPRSVPIRRTIQIIVREEQLAIVPGDAPTPGDSSRKKVIPLQGDTIQALDEFVKQVRAEVDGWGMAGNGLYWRPVLVLTVGPEGQRRADDLARLLKNSGFETRTDQTARINTPGGSNETR